MFEKGGHSRILCIFVCFSFALVLLSSGGCSRKKTTASSSKPVARPALQTIEEVPADLRKSMEEFAGKLENDFSDGDTNGISGSFDRNAVVDAIFEGADSGKRSFAQ